MNENRHAIALRVNGRATSHVVEPRTLLIDLLRDDLRLTGSHVGCEEGLCGACTVEIDGETVKSCMLLAAQADGTSITTVEGVGADGGLDPVQQAFQDCFALQCGYCTPGVVMSARALLAENADPSDEEVQHALSGNLCRCTGYQNIVKAVRVAGERLRGEASPETVPPRTSWIVQAVPRQEDRRLLLGGGRYTDDASIEGSLFCALVRSPHAHAEILSIDPAPALALPSVVRVVTGAEAKPHWQPYPPTMDALGVRLPKSYPLAVERVRFHGEPVAAVLAETRAAAEDAALAVAVTYRPLPAVTSVAAALGERDAVPAKLYDGWDDNRQIVWDYAIGDVDSAFDEAAAVVGEEISSQRYGTSPMEPRAVHADFDPSDRSLTVRLSTQIPHHARAFFGQVFGLPESSIRVIAEDVGGGFGGKLGLDPEYIPVLLSILSGRPVRWVERREEWLLAGPQARDFTMQAKAAFDSRGRLTAFITDIHADMGCDGAERAGGLGMPIVASIYAPGGYRLENYRSHVTCAVTNKAPYGACRGYGKDIANMAMEKMMDRGAAALGLDPLEIRRRNLAESYPHQICTGPKIESGSLQQAIVRLGEIMDLAGLRARQAAAREEGRYLGLATVSYIEPCGGSIPNSIYQNAESATVRVAPDGSVRVFAGVQSIGQGVRTALAQVAAETLGCHPSDVRVSCGDTDSVPFGLGAYSGRGVTYGVGAVLEAAERVKAKLLRAAGNLLQADPGDLVLRDGAAEVEGDPGRRVSLKEIGRAVTYWPGAEAVLQGELDPTLEATAVYRCPQTNWVPDERGFMQLYTSHPGGALGVLLEVDAETGEIAVERFWTVADHGKIINPATVDAQIVGGTIQQLGGSVTEALHYDAEGRLLTRTLRDYGMPNVFASVPIEIEHLETLSPGTAIGAKGVGESGCIATTTVLMQAVEDALSPFGVTVSHSPLTPWAVRALIAEAARQAPQIKLVGDSV